MKLKLIIATIYFLLSVYVIAQKKYDCVINTKDSIRVVGYLSAVTDSAITVNNQIFNWQNLQVVRFRKHKGFMRTVFPIAISSSAIAFAIELAAHPTSTSSLAPFIFVGGTVVTSAIITIPVGTVIYFLTRNNSCKINSYDDFLKLKAIALKYASQ